jgi:hypothetical protein
MCYKHLRDQVKRKFGDKEVPKDKRDEIIKEVNFMQRIVREEHFTRYWALFKKEYEMYPKFTDFF